MIEAVNPVFDFPDAPDLFKALVYVALRYYFYLQKIYLIYYEEFRSGNYYVPDEGDYLFRGLESMKKKLFPIPHSAAFTMVN